ncbi:MAG: GNAT family N-acetyltransferase [Turicibacter sp.]
MEKHFDEIYMILDEAFPKEEIRTYEGQRELLSREDYDILMHHHEGQLIGICAYYEMDDYLYIEHLACKNMVRGMGTGTKLMQEMIAKANAKNKLLVLEVEPAMDEVTTRRIRFYERLGLTLDSRYHFQPSLNPDTEGVELKLMVTKSDLLETEHQRIRETLNEYVYHVSPRAYFKNLEIK